MLDRRGFLGFLAGLPFVSLLTLGQRRESDHRSSLPIAKVYFADGTSEIIGLYPDGVVRRLRPQQK